MRFYLRSLKLGYKFNFAMNCVVIEPESMCAHTACIAVACMLSASMFYGSVLCDAFHQLCKFVGNAGFHVSAQCVSVVTRALGAVRIDLVQSNLIARHGRQRDRGRIRSERSPWRPSSVHAPRSAPQNLIVPS